MLFFAILRDVPKSRLVAASTRTSQSMNAPNFAPHDGDRPEIFRLVAAMLQARQFRRAQIDGREQSYTNSDA